MDKLKEYIKKELELTDEQKEKVAELYAEHRGPGSGGIVPMNVITIEFQLTTIGTAKIAIINGKRFIINEDEMDNL